MKLNFFPVHYGNFEGKAKTCSPQQGQVWGTSEEQLETKQSCPRAEEDFITQVSEEIEGRVTEKLSQEFSRTKNFRRPLAIGWVSSEPANLGPFQIYSCDIPDALGTNQGTNRDESRGILILKRESLRARLCKFLAQMSTATDNIKKSVYHSTSAPSFCSN